MLPFLLLLVLLLHYGEGKCCSNFRRWCRRYDAVFTAVDAAITLWRGRMLLKFSQLVSALCYPFFCRGCRRYAALNVLQHSARVRTFTQLRDGETLSRFVRRIRYY